MLHGIIFFYGNCRLLRVCPFVNLLWIPHWLAYIASVFGTTELFLDLWDVNSMHILVVATDLPVEVFAYNLVWSCDFMVDGFVIV